MLLLCITRLLSKELLTSTIVCCSSKEEASAGFSEYDKRKLTKSEEKEHANDQDSEPRKREENLLLKVKFLICGGALMTVSPLFVLS